MMMAMMMTIAQIITRNPHCLKESDTVLQAAKIMKEQVVGIIPIVDENQKPCGVLTDRDIVIRCIGENHDYNQCKINSVFSKGVEKVYEDQTLDEVLDIMKRKQLRRLVCVDRNDKLCGLVSLSDLAHHVGDTNLLGDLLRQIHLEKGQEKGVSKGQGLGQGQRLGQSQVQTQ
jgi:CBS domain-containing protein